MSRQNWQANQLVRGVVIFLCLVFSGPSQAAMFTQAWGSYYVRTTSDPPYSDWRPSYSIPYVDSMSVDNPINGAFAGASYSVLPTSFDVSYSLLRPPTIPSRNTIIAEATGRIDIKVDEPVQYVLSAEMSVIDPEGRNTHQWLRLYDNGTVIFNNFQLSTATVDPHFVLGRQDGDLSNVLIGSLSGVFLPNRTYRFEYDARLADSPGPSLQTATATGYFSLVIVPEPSVAVLATLGLVGLSAVRTRSIARVK